MIRFWVDKKYVDVDISSASYNRYGKFTLYPFSSYIWNITIDIYLLNKGFKI